MRAPFTLTTTSTTIIITTSLLLSFITAARAEFSCSAVGYFPHPSDCSQFYRCTDIWSTGQYQQYEFQCAEGTVFDVSIREQVAGCGLEAPVGATETPSAPETTPADTTPGTTPGTEIPSVTFRPAAGSPFQCSQPGPVRDEAHCNKFWLCREETEGSGVLESLLYRCPNGYLFNNSELRCKKEEDVSCLDTPETRNVNIIQLTEDMLESFFNKWG